MRGVLAALLRASEILNLDADVRPLWRDMLANLAALPSSDDADALKPGDYRGPKVFVRGRKPAVKAGGLLPDQNSLPMWFFDLCNPLSTDSEMLRVANATFDAYFPKGIDVKTPIGVLSKLPIAAATLGRSDATAQLITNQIRVLTPERGAAYKRGAVLENRMTLREGPQALDAERLGRAAEAVHLSLLQSGPPAPGEDPILCLFPAWPKSWEAKFTLLARGNFVVSSSIRNGKIGPVNLVCNAGGVCRMKNPWGTAEVEVQRGSGKFERVAGTLIEFETAKRETVIVRARQT